MASSYLLFLGLSQHNTVTRLTRLSLSCAFTPRLNGAHVVSITNSEPVMI
jgi:hypothetical protein